MHGFWRAALGLADRERVLTLACGSMGVGPLRATAEAVASGTPLLYLDAVPGCESRNLQFMTSRGFVLGVEEGEFIAPLLRGFFSGSIDVTAMLRRRAGSFSVQAVSAAYDLLCNSIA